MEMQLLSSVWRGGGERGETEIDSGLAVSQHQQDDSLLPLSERVTRSVALSPSGVQFRPKAETSTDAISFVDR